MFTSPWLHKKLNYVIRKIIEIADTVLSACYYTKIFKYISILSV